MQKGLLIDNLYVADLKQVSWGCPSQWVGNTHDGRPLFIDYRNASLRVWFSEMFFEVPPDLEISYGYDSVLTYQELRKLLHTLFANLPPQARKKSKKRKVKKWKKNFTRIK